MCIFTVLYRQSKSEPWDSVQNAGSSSRTLPWYKVRPVAVIFKVQHFLATTLYANQSFEGRPSNLLVCINKTDQESWHIPSTQYSQLNKTSQPHGTARRRTLPTIAQYIPHNYPIKKYTFPISLKIALKHSCIRFWRHAESIMIRWLWMLGQHGDSKTRNYLPEDQSCQFPPSKKRRDTHQFIHSYSDTLLGLLGLHFG